MNCKNLFSYPDGTMFSGKEILDFIDYHTTHTTGKTKIAMYMKKQFGNVEPKQTYLFFRKWMDTNHDIINKPRLLRIDHQAPVSYIYNCLEEKFESVCYNGIIAI